jgi:hypothetical protein
MSEEKTYIFAVLGADFEQEESGTGLKESLQLEIKEHTPSSEEELLKCSRICRPNSFLWS